MAGGGGGGGAAPKQDDLTPHPVKDQLPGVSYCITSPPPWRESSSPTSLPSRRYECFTVRLPCRLRWRTSLVRGNGLRAAGERAISTGFVRSRPVGRVVAIAIADSDALLPRDVAVPRVVVEGSWSSRRCGVVFAHRPRVRLVWFVQWRVGFARSA